MSGLGLVLRYGAFAAVAVAANLAVQRAILSLGTAPGYFLAALAGGTLVGLVVKYLLDKRWIFFDRETGLGHHRRKFGRYAGIGLFTTAIFWAFETLFWLIWHSTAMRELGAILGLCLGYLVKYQLDRRYVFARPALGNGR